jgi:hypothetical protein
MDTIAQVSTMMQTLLTSLTETVATAQRFTKRPDVAKFTASTLVQTLVWGFLSHPHSTVEQLAQIAARVGSPVSPQAIDQRFTQATADLLEQVLHRAVRLAIAAPQPVAIPILQRFAAVLVRDSTVITLPAALADHYQGCGGHPGTTPAAIKCGLEYDLVHGTWTHFDLVDGRTHDRALPLVQAPSPAGALHLHDLGFFDLHQCARIAASGGYYLTRVLPRTTLGLPGEAKQSLSSFVAQVAGAGDWDGMVVVGGTAQLVTRLVVQRVPQAVADARRRRMYAEAKRDGTTPSQARLTLAAWTIMLTNCPQALLALDEALVLLTVRWQIELVFKLWKSHGALDAWRTSKPLRVLCELYAKWIGLLVQHWLCLVGCWGYAERSMVKAAQVIRSFVPELASARGQASRFITIVTELVTVLAHTARMNPRAKQPNSYQRLLALTQEFDYA